VSEDYEYKHRLLKEALPKPFTIGTRVIFYSLIVLVASPFIVGYVHKRMHTLEYDESCQGNPDACAVPGSRVLLPLPTLVREGDPASERMRFPCSYTGTWSVRKDGGYFEVNLNENGTYAVKRNPALAASWQGGWWGVQGNYFVWRPKGRPVKEPSNSSRLLLQTSSSFVVAEADGSYSPFELVDHFAPVACTA
jgi:hypothetical protein